MISQRSVTLSKDHIFVRKIQVLSVFLFVVFGVSYCCLYGMVWVCGIYMWVLT